LIDARDFQSQIEVDEALVGATTGSKSPSNRDQSESPVIALNVEFCQFKKQSRLGVTDPIAILKVEV
jgi:hypothetical protein